MITVPEATEEFIKQSPFLEKALSDGLLNLSALARELKPSLEKRLYKNVSSSSIMMALKRLEEKLKKDKKVPNSFTISDLTVRSNLVELTFTNSPTLLQKQEKLYELIKDQPNLFLTFTRGVYETTIFANSSLEKEIKEVLEGEYLKKEFSSLSSITLILPEESVEVAGVYEQILKILAFQGINVVEVISSFTELTIFLHSGDIDKAFSILKNLH